VNDASSTKNISVTDDAAAALLQSRAALALEEAKKAGATAAEANVSRSQGVSVNVRKGEVETVEHNRDKSLVVTCYIGDRVATASTSDFSDDAVRQSVRAAMTIADKTAGDPAMGLADAELMATEFPDLGLLHPWDVSIDDLIDIALRTENAALTVDKRITNTEGGSASSHEGADVYANSHGFVGTTRASRHGYSCSVIGESDGNMQRDYWYSSARDSADLDTPESVGAKTAERTLRRLGSRQMDTTRCPVVYEAPIASGIVGHFIGAIRGSSLYRKASFLVDSEGQKVWADGIRIHEDPYLYKGMGSSAFDGEGVATRARDIVTDGVVQGYVLASYSARKLGLSTTANAGGVRNLMIDSGDLDLDGILKKMGKGLLVTELIGFGVNNVTGDYSRGASGFWIEDGAIAYPVEEITIAGNLADMFKGVAAVGNDIDTRGNVRAGSIMIDELTVAGG